MARSTCESNQFEVVEYEAASDQRPRPKINGVERRTPRPPKSRTPDEGVRGSKLTIVLHSAIFAT